MSSTIAILCASLALSGQPVRCGACRGPVASCPAPFAAAAPVAPQAAVATTKTAPTIAAAPLAAAPAPASPAKAAPATAAPTASVQDAKPAPTSSNAPPTATTTPNAVVAAKPVDELQLQGVEQGVLERTNAERARYGLRPLIIDRLLLGQARRHAAWMASHRAMQHTSQAVAENIAAGQHSSTEVVQTWMNSSGHRANILNAGYSRIGVAAYASPEGSIYWCQQFLR